MANLVVFLCDPQKKISLIKEQNYVIGRVEKQKFSSFQYETFY